MADQYLVKRSSSLVVSSAPGATLQRGLQIARRQRRLAFTAFAGVLFGALLVALFLPAKYEAELKLLMTNHRADPIVSGENVVQQLVPEFVQEEQLNSEVELLSSDDVLRKVVATTKLGDSHPSSWPPWNRWRKSSGDDERTVAGQVEALRSSLKIELIPKTSLISVRYRSKDPALAASVVNSVGNAYLQKHLEVHRLPGQYEFFDRQVAASEQELAALQSQLQQQNLPPQAMRDAAIQKLNEFSGNLEQTQASIRETEQRIRQLEKQKAEVPPRQVTAVRAADNTMLMQQLKSTLLTLEIKRVELLSKYQPTYRTVVEIDQQIAEAKAAIAHEENSPPKDESTAPNPTYEWIDGELVKARAELIGLRARASALLSSVDSFRKSAHSYDQESVGHDNLVRSIQTVEQNLTMYQKKREEARVAEALDQSRILNVAIAQSARVPVLPIMRRSQYLMVGFVLACLFSVGAVFLANRFDPIVHSREDVAANLGIPVLAALPYDASLVLNSEEVRTARWHGPRPA